MLKDRRFSIKTAKSSKKILYIFASMGCLFIIFSIYLFNHPTDSTENTCAFCEDTVLSRQTFYEDNLIVALYTYKPIFPGHCLIIPKRHVERFEMLSEAEIKQIGEVIKKVHYAASAVFNTSAYLILQKNGKEVGQSVPHVHFHYIPRKKGDSSTLKFLAKMYIANWQNPLSDKEMQPIITKMKQAIIYTKNE